MRFRLYIDESGDHTYKNLDDINRRYLGLTGIAIESDYYRLEFKPQLEALKQSHFPHNPDSPLSYTEMISSTGVMLLVC